MIIGITGGIGSGKSTVAKALQQQGYMVYDCDAEAKRIILSDSEVRKRLTQIFGPETYRDGIYQTRYVAQQVFSNAALLRQLNAVVHPAVRANILLWHEQMAPRSKDQMCFVESALLFQADLDSICQRIVLVTAPLETRIARAMARDNATRQQIINRIQTQISDDELRLRAHAIINNDGQTSISELTNSMLQNIKKAIA